MLEFTRTHKYFEQILMVCRSVAKKDSNRFSMKYIEVNDKHIVATDGHRLACLDNFGIEPGQYIPVKVTKSKIQIESTEIKGNFPKYQDIMPASTMKTERAIMPDHPDHPLSLLVFGIAKHGACVKVSYAKDFMACDSYYVISKNRPVAFYAKNFVGIIMPINVE